MDPRLARYLAGRVPVASERVAWPSGMLDVASYFTEDEAPLELVTSVRAIARAPHGIVVFDEPAGGTHVVPGGRRMAGEHPLDALRRELEEETGLTLVGTPRQLGVALFHPLTPSPEAQRSPQPDFLHVVYAADVAGEALRSVDDFVLRPRCVSAAEALTLALPVTERVFLARAVGA